MTDGGPDQVLPGGEVHGINECKAAGRVLSWQLRRLRQPRFPILEAGARSPRAFGADACFERGPDCRLGLPIRGAGWRVGIPQRKGMGWLFSLPGSAGAGSACRSGARRPSRGGQLSRRTELLCGPPLLDVCSVSRPLPLAHILNFWWVVPYFSPRTLRKVIRRRFGYRRAKAVPSVVDETSVNRASAWEP